MVNYLRILMCTGIIIAAYSLTTVAERKLNKELRKSEEWGPCKSAIQISGKRARLPLPRLSHRHHRTKQTLGEEEKSTFSSSLAMSLQHLLVEVSNIEPAGNGEWSMWSVVSVLQSRTKGGFGVERQ